MSALEQERLWSKSEAARYMASTESFVIEHTTRREPRLVSVKIGNKHKYRKSDLDAFIQVYANKAKAAAGVTED
jgi:hypothetical protein